MGIIIFLFIMNLLVPAVMLLGGWFMYKCPPKSINNFAGYRTRMSKKSQDTWDFAHDYCGRLWIRLGGILLILSIMAQLPFMNAGTDFFGYLSMVIMLVQLAVLLGSLIPVEKALRRTFDENGKRK